MGSTDTGSEAPASSPARDQYAEVDGLRLRYWMKGRGPDVLLLHGLGGSVEDWDGAFRWLDGNFHLWALDLPGAGRSEKPVRGYSVESFVHVTLQFLDLKGIERPHIIGVSMGAGIGIALSIHAPARVSRLVLVSPALLGRRLHPFLPLCAIPLLGELLLHPSPALVERYITWCVADPKKAPSEWVAVHKELASLPGAKRAFLATLRAGVGILGIRQHVLRPILAALPRLSPETLIVCGEQDRFIPTKYARKAAGRIPNARFVSFPNCGHVLHVECAPLFYPLVSSFLRGESLPGRNNFASA